MTNASRWRELAESLERHLAQATEEQHLTRRGRIDWISHHLGLYVGRFGGFAHRLGDRAAALLSADPFAVVDLATDRLTRELQFATPPNQILEAWQLYLDALDRVRHAPTVQNIDALRLATARWQTTLASTNW